MTPARIKRLRARLEMSQPAFADFLGVSVGAVRDWEQARVEPSGPAAKLLELADLGVFKPKK